MRYARGVIESFVDLTYRGLALGRRIQLTEVRPATAFVELATPMPVGTQVAIVTDDGLALDATVTWIHEQVTGSDRAPGMVIAPALAAEAAAAWWKARVALPEDAQPRPQPSRTRPVTVRPRSALERTAPITEQASPIAGRSATAPPVAHPVPDTDEIPTVITIPPGAPAGVAGDGASIRADLQARVLAAAGLEASRAPSINERVTVAMNAIEDPTSAAYDLTVGDVTVAAIPLSADVADRAPDDLGLRAARVDAARVDAAIDDSAGEVTAAYVAPDNLASDTIPPDNLAPDNLASDTLPPDNVALDTLPPDNIPSDTIAPYSARRTGEHEVIDDGKATMIMDAIDPSTLGLDLPLGGGAGPTAITDEPSAPVITIEADSDGEGEGEDEAPSAATDPGAGADKPAGRGKRRRKRR